MLTILGKSGRDRFCDGMSRRSFIRIGALGMGGIALPQLLSAEAAAGVNSDGRSHKATIMIFLPGGPPHQDMWDIKTDAPSEIRGEFDAIRTNVKGIEIGDQFPLMAKMADKFVFVRSIVGADGSHDAFQCITGRSRGQQPAGGWPCFGAMVSKLQGPLNPAIPPALGLSPRCGHVEWGDNGGGGFLGPGCTPFAPEGENLKQDLVLNGASLDRLNDRKRLLNAFDNFRRETDATGAMEGMDTFQRQAFGMLTSAKLADALDLSKEPEAIRKRYGTGSMNMQADGAWKRLDQFLLARRLVEAGARCVTLAFSRWDWHGNNFGRGREDMPMLDQGVSALVQDLHDRGLDRDVSVVVWGEFGRTPKINNNAGRDHWPQVSCAVLAGGGMQTGQVVGSTNRLGEYAQDRPVHFQDVFATLYHNMGIDPHRTYVKDLHGRPTHLIDPDRAPIAEIL
ncbi:MAG: DUF1501 domain-containing protein [Phycisphaera sp.]|nr:DUF1501 domain-containing protein [Phycisphaera sp.]